MSRTTLKMYFLVEGETEKLYLEWLAAQITAASAKYRVLFRIAVRSAPYSCVKRFQPPEGTPVYVLLDYESTDPAHETTFRNRLREMRTTSERTGTPFVLGYANYAFELWLILHRIPFSRSVYHRRDYLGFINSAFHTDFRSMHNYKKAGSFRRLLSALTLGDVRSAILRSQQIRAACEKDHYTLLSFEGYRYYRHDPSLSVDIVISEVLRTAELTQYIPSGT